MVRYNHTKTAYKHKDSKFWRLVPDGKKRAPGWLGFGAEGPTIPFSTYDYPPLTEEHLNLITQRDRVLLLESIAGGCFDNMWNEMKHILRARSKRNYKILQSFVAEEKDD